MRCEILDTFARCFRHRNVELFFKAEKMGSNLTVLADCRSIGKLYFVTAGLCEVCMSGSPLRSVNLILGSFFNRCRIKLRHLQCGRERYRCGEQHSNATVKQYVSITEVLHGITPQSVVDSRTSKE